MPVLLPARLLPHAAESGGQRLHPGDEATLEFPRVARGERYRRGDRARTPQREAAGTGAADRRVRGKDRRDIGIAEAYTLLRPHCRCARFQF